MNAVGAIAARDTVRAAATARRAARAGLALAAIALLAGPARAEGDVEAARPIIADRCTVCHHVPGYPAPQYTAGGAAASFQDIADGSQYDTPEKLTAFLHQPHFIIPGFSLSDEDIDNLVAFIVALRHE